MVRGTVSKLLFIDSSVNTHGDHTKVLVPPHPLSATGNERLALSLVSFSMRRNWYNLNPTNGIFYLFVAGTHYEVTIAPGVYSTFTSLVTAIQDALTVTVGGIAEITSAAIGYTAVTRHFGFVFTMATGHTATEVQVRCFAIKGGTLPAGVSVAGGFNDSHEILGAKPIRSAGQVFNSLAQPAAINALTSLYPASLNTLDAVYIHINTIETGNFMSTGFESHAQESLRLIESSMFARIPFDDSSFTETHEVVSFEDSGGDMYQSFLQRKHIDTLDIRVTDARGRSLAQLDPTQADNGLMSYKLCLRWDLFVPPPTPQPANALRFDSPPTI
jgi:hypothetical protein